MNCSARLAEIEFDRKNQANERAQQFVEQEPIAFMASNLCYGEPLDLYLHGDQQLTHDMLVESVINSDELASALIAAHSNDLLPLQELMSECAKSLINKARGE